MSARSHTFVIELSLKLSSVGLFPFDGALRSHLHSRASQEHPISLVFRPLEHVDEDREVLSETTERKHVVTGVPLAV